MHQTLKLLLGNRRRIVRYAKNLPGTPDFYIPSLNVCVFVQSCFWHCCPRHSTLPASNRGYWLPKLRANVTRDRRVRRQLNRLGCSVWWIWEHDLKGARLDLTVTRLARRLAKMGVRIPCKHRFSIVIRLKLPDNRIVRSPSPLHLSRLS